MKVFIFLLCSITLLRIDILELREKYPEAHADKALTNNLNEKLATISIADEPKMVAYKGAVLTLMAKHAKAIKEKKMYFKEGAQLLESAVDKAPNDLEIRYLRLSVQEHAPKLVKYSSNIEEDKHFIQEEFKTQGNTLLKTYIKSYVKASSLFTDEEKQAF